MACFDLIHQPGDPPNTWQSNAELPFFRRSVEVCFHGEVVGTLEKGSDDIVRLIAKHPTSDIKRMLASNAVHAVRINPDGSYELCDRCDLDDNVGRKAASAATIAKARSIIAGEVNKILRGNNSMSLFDDFLKNDGSDLTGLQREGIGGSPERRAELTKHHARELHKCLGKAAESMNSAGHLLHASHPAQEHLGKAAFHHGQATMHAHALAKLAEEGVEESPDPGWRQQDRMRDISVGPNVNETTEVKSYAQITGLAKNGISDDFRKALTRARRGGRLISDLYK